MQYTIEVYDALCSLSKFIINGIEADQSEFVENEDRDPQNAEDYGCGDMQAEIILPTNEILKKYKITLEEYKKIAEEVKEKVSFGACGWCA